MTSLLRAIKIQNHSSDNTALLPMRVNPPRAEPDAAQLKEKLASLNLKGDVSVAQISTELEKSPSPQDADAFSVDAGGADSGYGSTASTPQENKQNFLDRTSVPVSVPQVFDKPISDDQRDRFFDFRYQYTNSLWKAISKGNKKAHPGDISMKLKYMGSDEESAKLFIVIQCEKRVAKRVRHFFAQEHIQQDLKPEFEVYILDKGVIRLSTEDTLDVFAHLDGRVTFCGMSIRMVVDAAETIATFGGLITVTRGEITEVFGLTASHPVEGSNDLDRSDDDDFDSEEFTDTDSISELNESDAYPQPSQSPKLNAMTSIGKVAHDSLRLSSTTSANHDWALIKLNTAVLLPNLAPDSHPPSIFGINLLASRVPLQPQQKIDVVVMTSHGLQKGSLVSNGSSIMMFPGRSFLQTLDLVLRSDSELRPGDSGSWVVSETTHEVYGHVISVDALGEAHVVPLESTLSDIRAQLDVDEVALPTKADLELSWTETPKITGDSAMPMGDYALCIIQDNHKDWETEAASMFRVYRHAYLTVVAAAGDSCHSGFLSRPGVGPLAVVPFQSRLGTVSGSYLLSWHQEYSAWDANNPSHMSGCSWATRGWTLQEDVLSSRVVYFRDTTSFFRCQTQRCLEHSTTVYRNVHRWQERFGSSALAGPSDHNSSKTTEGRDKTNLYKLWRAMVAEYSLRNLTVEEDKLPAISGLARSFNVGLDDQYFAGLWRGDFVRALFWSTRHDAVKPAKFCAPSWSWASWKGEVGWSKSHSLPLVTECKIHHIYVAPLGSDLFGRVKGGYVDLTGSLRPVSLRPTDVSVLADNDPYRVDLFQEGVVEAWARGAIDGFTSSGLRNNGSYKEPDVAKLDCLTDIQALVLAFGSAPVGVDPDTDDLIFSQPEYPLGLLVVAEKNSSLIDMPTYRRVGVFQAQTTAAQGLQAEKSVFDIRLI
ncbi:hypothetical protein QC764_0074720 [Podospora pseudoanserina]|uniref:Heterokaryon incompatibility domain-containing protein n=1 Tax=Podospora pseudoanserina TaxID=2609844 RepID=A0ABR0I419_9PEZI|nr:hypothetical protein QC764_0074720 [Podospora pseudoanserina]